MNEKCQIQYRFTVDCEFDWGGRANETKGLEIGLPKIIDLFQEYKVKGLFFISTELFRDNRSLLRPIFERGHEIGCHGHFHIPYKERWRAEQDKKIAETFLLQLTGCTHFHYRAPKFHHLRDSGMYSTPNRHVSLLKHMWLKEPIQKDTIIYIHPFDIVGGSDATNLFCKLWYSRPKKAYETLINLLSRYH